MKKTVSVRAFKEYCANNKLRSVLYATENQSWYSAADPCKVKLIFPTILIAENPNVICLKSGSNTLCIDRVTEVRIDTESSVLGTIFTVFCGDMEIDNAYTLIAAS